jgi:hypothetical protein
MRIHCYNAYGLGICLQGSREQSVRACSENGNYLSLYYVNRLHHLKK